MILGKSQRTLYAWIPTWGRVERSALQLQRISRNSLDSRRWPICLSGVASLYGSNFRSIPEITTECVGSSLSASTPCRGRTRWHFFPESLQVYRILAGKYFDHPRYGVIAHPSPFAPLPWVSLLIAINDARVIRREIHANMDHHLSIAFHGCRDNSRDNDLCSRDFHIEIESVFNYRFLQLRYI